VGVVGATAVNLSGIYLSALTTSSSGDVTVDLIGRDGVAAEVFRVEATLTAGELGEFTAADEDVPAETLLYVEVTDGAVDAADLQGWYEMQAPGSQSVLAMLTTRARVLEHLGKVSTPDGDLIDNLVASVSVRMQGYMRRNILSTAYTGERHSATGRDVIQLRHWPLIGAPTVTVGGTAVAAGDLDTEPAMGWVFYGAPGSPTPWPAGRRHIAADYTAGYAVVPADLVAAATVQVVWEYKVTGPKGDRLRERSTVFDEGAATTYMWDAWAPEVPEAMHRYMRSEVPAGA